ncbi:MAG: LysR substrate-binding domain-containing protein [Rhodospirillales bacterium]|jgi:DNA-binding transcriptional LysR family regulator
MRFDLADLRLFVAVAASGSITKGAAKAHLALASASARLAAMEEEAGVDLLVRGRRGVAPTAAGEALLHHAQAVLDRAQALRAALGEYADGFSATVRVACNTAALTEFLPQHLVKFLVANPRIDVEIAEQPSYAIATSVAQGAVDLGIAADSVPLGELAVRPFETDRLVAILPPGDRLRHRKSIAYAEIAARPFVGLNDDAALSHYIGQYVARAGHRPRFRVRVRDFDAVCRLVGAGIGVAIVPITAALRMRRQTRVVAVALEDAWMLRRLVLCARSFETLPAAARNLAEALARRSA